MTLLAGAAIFQKASVINDLAWDKNNYVTKTDVTGTTFGSEHRRSLTRTASTRSR